MVENCRGSVKSKLKFLRLNILDFADMDFWVSIVQDSGYRINRWNDVVVKGRAEAVLYGDIGCTI